MEKGGSSAIFVGIGANLDHPIYGAPRRALEAALAELERRSVRVLRLSPWYRTAPVPVSDQPWYLNAVVEVGTDLPADSLLARLHEVEELFGRVRTVANAARVIDMDLLDFRGEITVGGPGRAILPHPRMEGRAFVLTGATPRSASRSAAWSPLCPQINGSKGCPDDASLAVLPGRKGEEATGACLLNPSAYNRPLP